MAYYVDHISSNGTIYFKVDDYKSLANLSERFDLNKDELFNLFPFLYLLKKKDGTWAVIGQYHEIEYLNLGFYDNEPINLHQQPKSEEVNENKIKIQKKLDDVQKQIKEVFKKPTIQKPKLNETQRKQKLQLWASRITNLEKISKPTFKQKQELNKLWKKFGEL